MEELKPCPFCGGAASVLVCDNEGNLHGDDYELDPWSGLGYKTVHNHEGCPATTSEDGGYWIYGTREEAVESWNRRTSPCDAAKRTNRRYERMRMKDQKGKVRRLIYIPNLNGFGAKAYVRVGLFKKIESIAEGKNAIDNLVNRLEQEGWTRF